MKEVALAAQKTILLGREGSANANEVEEAKCVIALIIWLGPWRFNKQFTYQ